MEEGIHRCMALFPAFHCFNFLKEKKKKKEGMKKKEKKEGRVVYPEARIGEKGQRKEVGLMVR